MTNWNPWLPEEAPDHSIDVFELCMAIAACATWGDKFSTRDVICHIDNEGMALLLVHRSTKSQVLMNLLRRLYWLEQRFNFRLIPRWIKGSENVNADNISRLRISTFRSRNPNADKYPTPIPWKLIPYFAEDEIHFPTST